MKASAETRWPNSKIVLHSTSVAEITAYAVEKDFCKHICDQTRSDSEEKLNLF